MYQCSSRCLELEYFESSDPRAVKVELKGLPLPPVGMLIPCKFYLLHPVDDIYHLVACVSHLSEPDVVKNFPWRHKKADIQNIEHCACEEYPQDREAVITQHGTENHKIEERKKDGQA